MDLFLVLLVISIVFGETAERQTDAGGWQWSRGMHRVEELVRRWAPLVWLAPGERYFPSDVSGFLRHVMPHRNVGKFSESWYLATKLSIDSLLLDSTSFLHGTNPTLSAVPVYAVVSTCPNNSALFQVTYWMFYPYSQGKPLCMVDTGLFGTWPVPAFNAQCRGKVREYGSHIGDWEHMSLEFRGHGSLPSAMYVSTHDAGAFYRYNDETGAFEYDRQEIRKGVLQRPVFPARANVTSVGQHPILFAARGSHGLWTAPGRHKYVKVAWLHDDTGYGEPWATWKHVQVIRDSAMLPAWLQFRGRWGNPKSKCHPVARLALSICQYSDGPTGIPMKENHFKC